MSTLREEAVLAFRENRDEEALGLLAEVVRRTPSDHRARMFGAQCLSRLKETERALAVLETTAENLTLRNYLLSATLAVKLGLDIRPGEPRLAAVLQRIHARAAASTRRAQVPPPLPPDRPAPAPADLLCAHLRGKELVHKAFEVLKSADDGAQAAVSARPPLPLFAFLDPQAFVDLVGRMQHREAVHGEELVREGERGESIFIIVAGRAKVEREVHGQKKLLAMLPGGSLFGELALLTGGRRSATVTAEGETELFEISQKDLEAVSRRFPEVPQAIAGYAEKRVAANLLVTAGLFDNLLADKRAEVLDKFKPRTVAAGENVVTEDAPASALFMVMAGELTVSKKNPAGERVVMNLLCDGDVFGEISLLNGGPATATVTAVRKSVVALMSQAEFQTLLRDSPGVAEYLRALAEGRRKAIADSMRPSEVLDAEGLVVEE